MPDKIVLHKRNGHRHLPGEHPLSLGQLIGLVHSDRAPVAEVTADLLRFATVVKWERLGGVAAHPSEDTGLLGPSLARVLDRTRALLDEGYLPELRQGLAKLAAQAEAAARMVAQLAQLTTETGSAPGGPGQRGLVDLNALITRTLGLMAARPGPKAEVAARLDPGIPRVAGDASQLQRALLTLVGVALRVAGEGGDGPGVRVETSQSAGALRGERVVAVRIEVRGAGPAGPAADEPPCPVAAPDTWMVPAVRLVVRVLAEHGGVLSMPPPRGARACFRLELPGV